MSARSPRRTFAHPFVITLAAMPACAGSSTGGPPPQRPAPIVAGGEHGPGHSNPPPPAYVDPASNAGPAAPAPAVPASQPAPGPAAPGEPAESRPQPKAPDYTERWLVTKDGATCLAHPKVECPKAAPGQPVPTCNPPPARAYLCPDGMSEPSITVVRYANTFECVIERKPVRCPPNARCNPPAPRSVGCPR